ncbi:uncharacterized protein J2W49_000613 [Hydrogenophaga palleronii]|uniref:Lipoprotein n=1 Tax=Hydrogenophaga palleronii TaxID=65655 RepID=A0ABU1WHE3_9BURK|nr:hypothetical protein [Hydrogenophaga palleronii]MDR7148685.1 uncharacterized protein [Hydrogenophaga palleronii]
MGLIAHAPSGLAQQVLDCAHPSERSDRLLCSDQDLQRAFQDAALRIGALASWSKAPKAWYQTQRLWERERRDPCENAECLRAAYQERNAYLTVLHETPTPVAPGPWTPLMPALVLQQVDDTALVRLPPMTFAVESLVRVEWKVPAGDRARWAVAGPGGRLLCQPPDAREGYAADFTFRQSTQGVYWPRWERDGQGVVFEVFSFVAGRDVPLNKPVRCSFTIGETLVDNPSVISVWQVPVVKQH